MCLNEFKKEAPASFQMCERSCCGQYKYCLEGKGCTLGVLFETSMHICFEWLTEDGRPVEYRPELRYKAWKKSDVQQLMRRGVWEPVPTDSLFDLAA